MLVPKIKVEISDLEYNTHSIAELLFNDFSNNSLPFIERIYKAFPQLSNSLNEGMSNDEIYNVVEAILIAEYSKNIEKMEERKRDLHAKLEELLHRIIPTMLDLFEVDWPKEYNYITCYLGLYAVFPRDVITKEYWIHYKTSEEAVIRATLHEINHFILLEKWKAMHGYQLKEQPSHPEVLWFLEEMAVDPTLNSDEMQSVAPFLQKAYSSFYENKLNGIPIEEYIIRFFKERKNMAGFLDTSYKFILENYDDILAMCG
jgi:hypothetical protein